MAFLAFVVGSAIPTGLWLAWENLRPRPSPPPAVVEPPTPPVAPVVEVPERVTSERITSFADMVDLVVPTVVSVYPSRLDRDPARYSSSDPAPAPFRRRFAAGSGVLVSQDGYILTTHHLLAEDDGSIASFVDVMLADGSRLPAALIGSDPLTDIAVLRIDTGGKDLPFLIFGDSETLRMGDLVFAVGNPLDVGLTVTMGIVSGTRRTHLGILRHEESIEDFIQTDATINPGNSGGPLVDAEGRLIGINSATLTAARSGGNTGIGFAIPGKLALRVMSSIIETGRAQRAWLGISVDPRPTQLVTPEGSTVHGVLVNKIEPGQSAEKAGIRVGDLLQVIGDRPVRFSREVRSVVGSLSPGTEVEVTLWRPASPTDTAGTETGQIHLKIVLGMENGPLTEGDHHTDAAKLPGVIYRVPTESDRERFTLPAQLKGVVLVYVARDIRLARDLRPGVVITEINGKPVLDAADVSRLLKEGLNRLVVYDHGAVAEILLVVRVGGP